MFLKGFIQGFFYNPEEGSLGDALLTGFSEAISMFIQGFPTNPFMFLYNMVAETIGQVTEAWRILNEITLPELLDGLYKLIITIFTKIYNELVGESIVPDTVNGILGWYDTLLNGVTSRVTALRNNVVGLFTEIINKAGETISKVSEVASQTASSAVESGKDLLPEWLRNRLPNLPGLDTGAYNIPRDMAAIVHKGEMIIPADQANQIRNSTTNNRFEPGAFVFPNVRTARDAQGVMDEIQRQINLGSLKAQTV
jgi:hypothetical protein